MSFLQKYFVYFKKIFLTAFQGQKSPYHITRM